MLTRWTSARLRREFIGEFAMFMIWLLIVVTLFWLSPNPSGHGTHTQLGLAPCPFFSLSGRLCPTCGITTSFCSIVQGDFASAFRAHALGIPLFAYLSTGSIYFGSKYFFGIKAVGKPQMWKVFHWSMLAVFLLYGAIRASESVG